MTGGTAPERVLDLEDLGLDQGAHLLLRRGLAELRVGQALQVSGRDPALPDLLEQAARDFEKGRYEDALKDFGVALGRARKAGARPAEIDILLDEGAVFVQPGDGEMSRIEGKLSKTPSFWTRRVDVVRRYERHAGVRVPMSIESVASVLIAGRSTFYMT